MTLNRLQFALNDQSFAKDAAGNLASHDMALIHPIRSQLERRPRPKCDSFRLLMRAKTHREFCLLMTSTE